MVQLAPTIDLGALLVPVDGMPDPALVSLGKKLFMESCVYPARQGEVCTHDGLRLYIYAEDFEHAFYTAATKERRGIAKDVIDPERVARTQWIVPIVSGLVKGTDCYLIRDYRSYRQPPPEKRLYVVRRERYVIWLLPKRNREGQPDGFRFKTAYVTGYSDIDRYTYRQRIIWSR